MPVNEKILFGSFQCLFSLKTIIYAILSESMLRENHAVLGGKNINFQGGGGGAKKTVFPQNKNPWYMVFLNPQVKQPP
jgi:hypothetical protein